MIAESAPKRDIDARFARAERAYLERQYDTAASELEAIGRAIGPNPTVLHLLALAERGRGRLAAAARAFEQALMLAPRDAQMHGNHANLLVAQQRHDAALAAFDMALRLPGAPVDIRLNRAALVQSLHGAEAALAALDAIPEAAAIEARRQAMRGAALLQLERLDAAAAAFDASLARDPNRGVALAGRARVALERGEANAQARFDAALAVRPDDPDLLLGRAFAQEAAGGASAIPVVAALVERHPGWTEGYEQLARMRAEAGEEDAVDRSFLPALAAAPDDAALHRSYWNTLMRASRFADLCRAIATAPAPLRSTREAQMLYASSASEAGSLDEADAAFAALDHATDTLLARGRHLLRRGEPEAAAASLERLVASDIADMSGWAHLSVAWRMTGDARHEWLCAQPGLVGRIDLGLDAADIAALAERLRDLHRTRAHPIGQSLRGGTQTRGRLLARTEPEIAALCRYIADAVARHVGALPPADPAHPLLRHRDRAFVLAGSWSVRLLESGFHVSHIHPKGVLSSACHVIVPAEAEDASLRAGWLELGAPPRELGTSLAPLHVIRPTPGWLTLFPSYLFHGTRPFDHGERLSVAFDVSTA